MNDNVAFVNPSNITVKYVHSLVYQVRKDTVQYFSFSIVILQKLYNIYIIIRLSLLLKSV